jgi:hypothetical protein
VRNYKITYDPSYEQCSVHARSKDRIYNLARCLDRKIPLGKNTQRLPVFRKLDGWAIGFRSKSRGNCVHIVELCMHGSGLNTIRRRGK